MTETFRWSHPSSEATPEERNILGSAQDASPPPGAEQRVWSAIAAAVGASVVSLSAHTTGASILKPATAAVLKALVIGSLGGAAVASTGWWVQRAMSSAAHVAPASPRMSPAAPHRSDLRTHEPEVRAVGSAAELAETDAQSVTPPKTLPTMRGHTPNGVPVADSQEVSRLKEEARMVHIARTCLGRGDVTGAAATLAAAKAAFGAGALAQEREALAIEVLQRSGQRDAAKERAAAFLQAFPDSPHAARVRRALY